MIMTIGIYFKGVFNGTGFGAFFLIFYYDQLI